MPWNPEHYMKTKEVMKIFEKEYPNFKDNNKIIKIIEDSFTHRLGYGKKVGGQRTSFDLYKNHSPFIHSFLSWQASLVPEITSFICGEEPGGKYTFSIADCWGIKYEEGEGIIKHNHFPLAFSCVYYLKVLKNSSPLVLVPFKNCPEYSLSIPIKENYLYVIPGSMDHYVEDNKSTARIVLTTNWKYI